MSEITLDDAYEEQVEETEVVEETTEEVEAETPEETEAETTAAEPETKEQSWTFSQAMDEREKRQEAVKRAEAAEAKLAELEGKTDDISVFDDETGSKEQERQRIQQEIRNNALNMSQAFAEEVYGEDKVLEAIEWMKAEGQKSPYVVDQFNTAKLPFHKAVKLYEAEQARLDPEAFEAKLEAKILKRLKAESEKTEEPQEAITPSLASKRSTGKDSKTTTDDFEDILGA